MKKNLNLLRPFNQEAAKRGEKICLTDGSLCVYEAGPDAIGRVCCNTSGFFFMHKDALRMTPLCWVEEKPVYKGDILFWKPEGRRVVVEAVDGDIKCPVLGADGCHYTIQNLTWSPPKVRREGWGVIRVGRVSNTREEAEAILKQHQGMSLPNLIEGEPRVARIEWEEPASPEGGAE